MPRLKPESMIPPGFNLRLMYSCTKKSISSSNVGPESLPGYYRHACELIHFEVVCIYGRSGRGPYALCRQLLAPAGDGGLDFAAALRVPLYLPAVGRTAGEVDQPAGVRGLSLEWERSWSGAVLQGVASTVEVVAACHRPDTRSLQSWSALTRPKVQPPQLLQKLFLLPLELGQPEG